MKGENEYLLKTPIRKLLFKFAVPCVLAMLVSALYNIVDQIFIGNSEAGTAGNMATTLVFPVTVVALALALLIGDGAAALYSLSMGAKDTKSAKKSIGGALVSLVISGVALMLIGFFLMEPILEFLGADGYSAECQEFARQYLTIILIGFPFFIFSGGGSGIVRATGAPTFSMVATIVGAVINLIFDPVLIFGFNMGIQGAAIATIAGQIVSALLVLGYFIRPPRGKKVSEAESTLTSEMIKLSRESFQIDLKILWQTVKLGVSSFITQISIAVVTIVANNVVGAIGGVHATDAGGAMGIVFKVFAIVISFVIGTAVGGQPIIGYNFGAKHYGRVLETYKQIILANIVIGLVATVFFVGFPELLVNIFGTNAADPAFYEDFAVKCFRIYLGGILCCCIQKASCVFFQAIGKPFQSMLLSMMRDVILLVPAILFFGFSFGLEGMLYAGPVADLGALIVTAVVAIVEVKKIKKLQTTSLNPRKGIA